MIIQASVLSKSIPFLEVAEENLNIFFGSIVVQSSNCAFHCSTETQEVQITKVLFLMVVVAVIPTNVLPAPHGSTIIPDLALPLENIFDKAIS